MKLLRSLVSNNEPTPLLSREFFGMTFRMISAWIGDINAKCASSIAELLYVASIVQAIVLIGEKRSLISESNISLSLLGTLWRENMNEIKLVCVPYLRRVNVLLAILFANSQHEEPSLESSFWEMSFDALLKKLQFTTFDSILESPKFPKLRAHIENWAREMAIRYKSLLTAPHSIIPRLAAPVPTNFIGLTPTYQDLVVRFLGIRCRNCKTIPKNHPGACMLCGELVCVRGDCCRNELFGEAYSHYQGGCGSGLFLMLRSSLILILRGNRSAQTGSLYLDEFGEEDTMLKR